jgi:cytochrome c oxidase subunit II
MFRKKVIIIASFVMATTLLLASCTLINQSTSSNGTGWGSGVFDTNGERIYFTATSDRGIDISYSGGPSSNGWMMMNGQLACVSCHGPDGHGGVHNMGMMQQMDAKDIRWKILESEFDTEKFRLAVEEGKDPDGTQLSTDMPRWKMSDGDISDLIDHLKTLP